MLILKPLPIDVLNLINLGLHVDWDSNGSPCILNSPGSPAQRFSSADTVLGFKDNGPIDKVLGNGDSGGNTYNFNLYGGDTAPIYNTIRTATKVSRGR